jgi:formylglycine-generating enzyme required for sulfatase activity
VRRFLLFVCSIIGMTVFAVPKVSGLRVTSIAPLGLALDYTVSGTTDDGKGCYLSVSMTVDGTTYVAESLTGATNCLDGAHRVYWNMAKDGITVEKADISVEVKYTAGVGARYCVVDLAGGSTAESYPVTYCFAEDVEPSEGFNTNEYKAAKLVLKRVDAGEFVMGDDQVTPDALKNHKVTLTKPFYMGLFEVTQKQWELVMGEKPSYFQGDTNPVECVSYDMIRGSSEGARWPATNSVDATSFLGKLREKTGIDFDLPTEAQWEYTCRAGTNTAYSCGDSANGDYMWYGVDYASGGTTHEVGTKKMNPWGFYDMHGNVWEWCLDWYVDRSLPYGEDPKGLSSGSGRVCRGGGFQSSESYCTSYFRNYFDPSTSDYFEIGFRLYRPLP